MSTQFRSGWAPDTEALVMPLNMTIRRRTTDGYSRVEMVVSGDVRVRSTYGEHGFVVYLTDEERRTLATALLDGLQ